MAYYSKKMSGSPPPTAFPTAFPTAEETIYSLFFSTPQLMQSTIIALCHSNKSPYPLTDTISLVIGVMITCPLDIQLASNGMHLFKDKDILFPYQHMSVPQREFLIELLQCDSNWNYYDCCLTLRRNKASKAITLDTCQVLQSLCTIIEGSKKFPSPQHRLAIMNIALQRIHNKVAISKQVQMELNRFLFKKNESQDTPGEPEK